MKLPIAEMRAELTWLREEREFEGKALWSMQKERNDVEAELARLREALREIADAPYLEDAEDIQAIARNALKETNE